MASGWISRFGSRYRAYEEANWSGRLEGHEGDFTQGSGLGVAGNFVSAHC